MLKFRSERKKKSSEDKEEKRDIGNLRMVVAQHYVDSLSNDETQMNFMKYWFSAEKEKCIDFGERSSYIDMISEYIKDNMSMSPSGSGTDSDSSYLYLMTKSNEPVRLQYAYDNEDNGNGNYKFITITETEVRDMTEKAEGEERVNFCYIGQKGENTKAVSEKTLKLNTFKDGDGGVIDQVCNTILKTDVNKYVDENDVVRDCFNIKKQNEPTTKSTCFQIEYKARMYRLTADSDYTPKLVIKYFSEYAKLVNYDRTQGKSKRKKKIK